MRLDGERILGPLALPDPAGAVSVACRRVAAGRRECALVSPGLDAPLILAFDADALPFLQLWVDPRPHAHVLGIEPATSDRLPDGRSGEGLVLAPGEARDYRIELGFD